MRFPTMWYVRHLPKCHCWKSYAAAHFESNLQSTKEHEKLPSMQKVKPINHLTFIGPHMLRVGLVLHFDTLRLFPGPYLRKKTQHHCCCCCCLGILVTNTVTFQSYDNGQISYWSPWVMWARIFWCSQGQKFQPNSQWNLGDFFQIMKNPNLQKKIIFF